MWMKIKAKKTKQNAPLNSFYEEAKLIQHSWFIESNKNNARITLMNTLKDDGRFCRKISSNFGMD